MSATPRTFDEWCATLTWTPERLERDIMRKAWDAALSSGPLQSSDVSDELLSKCMLALACAREYPDFDEHPELPICQFLDQALALLGPVIDQRMRSATGEK